MHPRATLFAILVASFSGHTVAEQAKYPSSSTWKDYASLSFEAQHEGGLVEKYQISQVPNLGKITSVIAEDTRIDLIETRSSMLIKGAGTTGIQSYEECMESVGEVNIAIDAHPSMVIFFLEQSDRVPALDSNKKRSFQVEQASSNAVILLSGASEIEIEGSLYPIGPQVELSAPWGVNGITHSLNPTLFELTYYSTIEGVKNSVNVTGEWSEKNAMHNPFDQQRARDWLACVSPETKSKLMGKPTQSIRQLLAEISD